MTKGQEHLYFKINNTLFKQTGVKRDKFGKFDLICIKNVKKKTFKYIQREKLEEMIGVRFSLI